MPKDFDTAPVRNRSDNKTLIKTKQPLTVIEGQTSDGTLYVVPDIPEGYGDERSVVAMTEDLVGRNTNSDTEAKQAGEVAGEQYNSDIRKRMRAIRSQQFYTKNPSAMQFIHRDNSGRVRGVTLLMALWNPVTEKTEYIEKAYDAETLLGHAISTGQNNLVNEALGKQ